MFKDTRNTETRILERYKTFNELSLSIASAAVGVYAGTSGMGLYTSKLKASVSVFV